MDLETALLRFALLFIGAYLVAILVTARRGLRVAMLLALTALSACGKVETGGLLERDCPKMNGVLWDDIEAWCEPIQDWLEAERAAHGVYPRELPAGMLDDLRCGEVDAVYRLTEDEETYSIQVGNYDDCLWELRYSSSTGEWSYDG